jgi:undecaprenyl-diphosphatase
MDWFISLILGVVQGITEFLPVSSDGHLNVVNHLLERATGNARPEKENIFFFVMLHVGTVAAIVVHYRREILAGVRGFLGFSDVPDLYRRPYVLRVGVLVGLATAVLIPDKLFFMKYIESAFQSDLATGVGFLITAAVLMVTVSQLSGGDKGPVETTALDALLIGLAQAFAPLPGVSRSGLTIAAALALGFRRNWAVQFSLMLAVPAICGAAVFEIKDVLEGQDRSPMTPDRIAQTVAATVVSGLVGYAAIVWLVRVVRSGRLWYFSVYLVILGLAVIFGFAATRRPTDARTTPAADRPARALPSRPSDRGVPPERQGVMARPFGDGARPARA